MSGIEKHTADLGWVVTCGRFSDEAKEEAARASRRIRLIEGDDLAKMVVSVGIDHIGAGLAQ